MIGYISTRGGERNSSFADILLTGTAKDGGLYIPEAFPRISADMLREMHGMSYATIAKKILTPFIGDTVEESVFDQILEDTYSTEFHHTAVAPLTQIGPNAWIMELFHGPTLSFKDYALQLLGRLFDTVLEQRNERLTIIGATSGDTGSAAIEACKGCKNIDIFILHPHERTSPIQRKQMTTVDAPNVFNIALEGHFDDCQSLVKTLFGDEKLNQEKRLAAINSINWARIMSQTVYYVAAAVALGAPDRPVSFSVPTGNFGNIYAAWVARTMGLPAHKFIIGSNRNDILTRFFETGAMSVEGVEPSLSPSMDIQVSSNFERFMCDTSGRAHQKIAQWMAEFKDTGSFSVDEAVMANMTRHMSAFRCSDDTTLEVMRDCYKATGQVIDPHTAVGLHAAMHAMANDPEVPMVSLACAHPAKFPDAVRRAIGRDPEMPERLAAVMDQEEHFDILPNDLDRVRAYVLEKTAA